MKLWAAHRGKTEEEVRKGHNNPDGPNEIVGLQLQGWWDAVR